MVKTQKNLLFELVVQTIVKKVPFINTEFSGCTHLGYSSFQNRNEINFTVLTLKGFISLIEIFS